MENDFGEFDLNNYDGAMDYVSTIHKGLGDLSCEFRNNSNIVMKAVSKNGDSLKYASDELRDDWYVVMKAVNQRGEALRYASDRLKNNYQVVLEAVARDGDALQYASEELKMNYSVVLTAILEKSSTIVYSPLKNDYTFIMQNIGGGIKRLKLLSDEMKDNYDVVLKLVQHDGRNIQYASERLIRDRSIALAAIEADGNHMFENQCFLPLLPYSMLDDDEIVAKSIEKCPFELNHASDRLKNNYEISKKMVKNHGDVGAMNLSDKMKKNYGILLQCAKKGISTIWHVKDHLREINLEGYFYKCEEYKDTTMIVRYLKPRHSTIKTIFFQKEDFDILFDYDFNRLKRKHPFLI